MDTHDSHARLRRPTLAHMLVIILATLLLASGFAASTAQSTQDERAQSEGDERRFENGIPAHVPLKVKVKNERAFKDKKNAEWGRDLEVEVKNTGDKPIYYMFVLLSMPDFKLEDGVPWSIRLKYGRKELWNLEEPILPEDVPVRPGESYTFTIPEEDWRPFKTLVEKNNKEHPKRIRFEIQFITFGDGTGFEGLVGVPTARPPKKQPQGGPPPKQGASGCQPNPEARALSSPAKLLKATFLREPAALLRADFLTPEPAPAAPAALDCNCQNVPNCFFGVIQQCASHCPCDDPCNFPSHVSTGSCSTSTGRCRQVRMDHATCQTQFNGEQTCSHDVIIGVCGPGDPTPTPPPPTPMPTPTPTPSPPPPCPTPSPACCVYFSLLGGICQRDCSLCPPNTPVGDGCVTPDQNGDCPLGFDAAGGGTCCPQVADGCTAEECEGDVNEGPGGETTGLQTDEGQCPCASPVLIDVRGDGFRLTNLDGGVRFDLNGDGRAGRLSWTAEGSDDAWLALDRDGDGLVTSGRELFGNLTAQPAPPPGVWRNGFLALAGFDKPASGGNSDGVIDARDAVFPSLRLWRDTNHDGLSQATELSTLASLDVVRLHLSYKESKREDGHGNRFRYRAKVDDARGAKVNRWAWDVFLLAGP